MQEPSKITQWSQWPHEWVRAARAQLCAAHAALCRANMRLQPGSPPYQPHREANLFIVEPCECTMQACSQPAPRCRCHGRPLPPTAPPSAPTARPYARLPSRTSNPDTPPVRQCLPALPSQPAEGWGAPPSAAAAAAAAACACTARHGPRHACAPWRCYPSHVHAPTGR